MSMIRGVLAVILVFVCSQLAVAAADDGAKILNQSGVRGGVVVHVGCGDGKLTAALRASDAFVVQGLASDSAKVAAARKYVQGLGVYGPVSISEWDGRQLPYAEEPGEPGRRLRRRSRRRR